METKKRLGKGLEELSHLFMSPATPVGTAARGKPTVDRLTQGRPRRFVLLSNTPGLPVGFWASTLAAAFARSGKRTLLIEGHSAPPGIAEMLNLPVIHASLSEFLGQKEKQLTLGESEGIRLLAFHVRPDELRALRAEERDILLEILRREEEMSDYLLITLDPEPTDSVEVELLAVNREAVVIAQAGDPVPVYRLLKALYHHNPRINVGIIVYGVNAEAEAAEMIDRLSATVKKFLDRSLTFYGIFPPDPILPRSLAARASIFSLGADTEISRRILSISAEMAQYMGQRAAAEEPGRLMFERLHRGKE